MNNNVYTVEVLGRDLQLNDIVLFDNQLFIIDVFDIHKYLTKFDESLNTLRNYKRIVNKEVYYRVTVEAQNEK